MKRIHVFAFLGVLVAGLPVSAMAQPSPSADPAPTHDGFYFNVTVGPAYSNYEITGSGNTLKADGGAASLDLRFGGAVTDHLVLSGVLGGSATLLNPDTTFNGASVSSSEDYQFGTSMVGVGLTYYFDNNLFLGFDAGVGQVRYSSSSTDLHSDSGFAAQVRFGKEWWVGDDWALGVVCGYKYLNADASIGLAVYDPHSGYHTVYLDKAKAGTVYIAFTVSFN